MPPKQIVDQASDSHRVTASNMTREILVMICGFLVADVKWIQHKKDRAGVAYANRAPSHARALAPLTRVNKHWRQSVTPIMYSKVASTRSRTQKDRPKNKTHFERTLLQTIKAKPELATFIRQAGFTLRKDNTRIIVPILQRLRHLRKLRLKFNLSAPSDDYLPSRFVGEIAEMPQLKFLSIKGYGVDGRYLARFLRPVLVNPGLRLVVGYGIISFLKSVGPLETLEAHDLGGHDLATNCGKGALSPADSPKAARRLGREARSRLVARNSA